MRWWGKRSSDDASVRASANGSVAAGGDIGMVVTGNDNQIMLAPAVRSAYWEQVRTIVPPELLDRQSELSELEAFCTAESGPAHAWWRAGAWAGKSALMSWFALHPPRGVRIVPFFVTARWRAQADARAYVDVVLEQLAELVGTGLPGHLTDATRQAHLLSLYAEAAHVCAARGERLVLLVDGLDEDQWAMTGPGAHSIAGLLPARPRGGMRVLVAGRLDPVLPPDVPDDHPLHDPSVVRVLAASPYAQTVRARAERELAWFEEGRPERDLLGLVATAGGGLAAADLAELTGRSPYWVRHTLRTHAGRSFSHRAGVYLLAHEALQAKALDMLEGPELSSYEARLHDWADTWRSRGWSAGTPDYLLRGYFQMLLGTGDTDRVVRCALDAARHERMLTVTGSDRAAAEEIRTARRLLDDAHDAHDAYDAYDAYDATASARGVPGGETLLSLLGLAVRAELIRGHGPTPTLARAWAALGQPSRAETLARTLEGPVALAGVSHELAAQGLTAHAAELLTEAEARLSHATNEHQSAEYATAVHQALAGLGLHDRAEELLRDHPAVLTRAETACRVVETWVEHGQFARASSVALRRAHPSHRTACGTALITALLAAGELSRALAAVQEMGTQAPVGAVVRLGLALRRADRHTDIRTLFAVLAGLPMGPATDADVVEAMEALADEGRIPPALRLLGGVGVEDEEHVERWATTTLSLMVRAGRAEELRELLPARVDDSLHETVRLLAVAFARRGDLDRVADVTGRVGRLSEHVDAEILAAAVEGCAAHGRLAEAESLAVWGWPYTDIDPVARGAVAWARAGHRQAAAEFLQRVDHLVRRSVAREDTVWGRARAAEALIAAGHVEAAREVLAGIESVLPPPPVTETRRMESYAYRSQLGEMARALARAGELDRATALLCRPQGITAEPEAPATAWTALVTACVAAGQYTRAEALVGRAPKLYHDELMEEAAVAFAAQRETARAVACAAAVRGTRAKTSATARTARALAEQGMPDTARALLADLPETHLSPDGDSEGTNSGPAPEHALLLADVFCAWAALGERTRAATLADDALRVPAAGSTLTVGWRLVRALVQAGFPDKAKWLTRSVPYDHEGHAYLREELVRALIDTGEHEAALAWARPLLEAGPAFTEIALALIPVVDPAHARTLVLDMLRVCPWADVLPAVLHLEPAAVPLLVDLFHDGSTAARTSSPSSS